jgi:hypothetical protein
MTIYAFNNTTAEILFSKPNNPHYLKRYIRFIEGCQEVNEDFAGYTEKHHICPQAKDLFPEYKSLKKHPWNCAILTPRQHFIAHHLLWKAYPEMKSMQQAFFLMCHKNNNKLDSRTYSRLSEENSKNVSESALKRVADKTHHLLSGDIQRESNIKRVTDKTHPFLGGEIARESAKKRVDDKTHNFLGGEIQRESARKRVADKTHHLLGGEMQRKRVADKTHNFLGGEMQRKRVADKTHNFLGGEMQRKRVADKTHHLLGGEMQRKRVADKTHNCLDSVACYDKKGTFVRIPKEIYHSQTGQIEDRDYVHVSTKEAKRRKQTESSSL